MIFRYKPKKLLFFTQITLFGAMLLFSSCNTFKSALRPVQPFELNRYLGKWYEIARLDFRFERNLSRVSATYSYNKDGSIRVDNRGYAYKKGKWKRSIGKAKFVDRRDAGKLKVSFFGPFYGAYNIVLLDKEYRYALVTGNSRRYLWILSREKTIPQEIRSQFLTEAKKLGYDINSLTWTAQE